MKNDSSFDEKAVEYDLQMGDIGDITHQHSIDPVFFDMIGSVENKTIYDIGCGNGYIDRQLIQNGAKELWASDISNTLIDLAMKRGTERIHYFTAEGSDFSHFDEKYNSSFDLVISNMAVHYIKHFNQLMEGVKRLLKPQGRFVFTIAHPIDDLNLTSQNNILNRDQIKKVMGH